MNSWLSKSGSFMRPARQSALACSMRSFEDETKFHSMNRSPTGSPPSAITVDGREAVKVLSSPGSNTSILPAPYRLAAHLDLAGGDVQRALGIFIGQGGARAAAISQCA